MKSRTLRILDYNSNCLSFDLKDIISECKHYDGHRWVAWDVECDSSNWYETFSEATNQQVEMSFNELIDYAENVGQTIDGFFLAIKPNLKKIPIINEDLDLRDIADLIINAHDSTFWEVTSSDNSVIEKLTGKFKKIELVSEPWWRERER